MTGRFDRPFRVLALLTGGSGGLVEKNQTPRSGFEPATGESTHILIHPTCHFVGTRATSSFGIRRCFRTTAKALIAPASLLSAKPSCRDKAIASLLPAACRAMSVSSMWTTTQLWEILVYSIR